MELSKHDLKPPDFITGKSICEKPESGFYTRPEGVADNLFRR
jgi:hypothetical protein